jgi:BASS family bile acid:Na+ symporter
MKEVIADILKIVAPLSVALIVFAQGLGIPPRGVARYFSERPGVLLRSLFAVLVLVPAAALAILLALKPAPALAVGLAILVACPPAPLMLKAAPAKGGASASFMASLHLILASLAFVTVPCTLYLLSIPLDFQARVDPGTMAWILARTILVPIAAGLAVRALFPRFADRFAPMLDKTGTVGLIVVIVFAMVAFYPALLNMDLWSYLTIIAVSLVAVAIGHWFGPSDSHEKTTLAVECGVRHPALAISIAAAGFTPQKALPILVPCVLTFILMAMIYLLLRGRSVRAAESVDSSTAR